MRFPIPAWTERFQKRIRDEGNIMVPYRAWINQVNHDLQEDEGFRAFAYPDPLSRLYKRYPKAGWGFKPATTILAKIGMSVSDAKALGHPWTVGFGFTKDVTPTTSITRAHANQLLNLIIIDHLPVLDKVVPNWRHLPLFAITVVVNMAFNMGSRLMQFKNSMGLINSGNYKQAAVNLRKSLWYKQTGRRAEKLITRLEKQAIAERDLAR